LLRAVAFVVCFISSFCRLSYSGSSGFFDRMLERHLLLRWKWRHTVGYGSDYQLGESLGADRGFSGIDTDCFGLGV
jgi:hypothetical protein